MMTIKTIVRLMVWLMLLVLPATASAFCTRTSDWTEDVLLHDGRVVKIEREVCSTFQFIAGDGGSMKLFASWPDKFWLKFKNPDTNETIKWQGEQYFYPVLLDFVEGVPYLVVRGRPDMETEEIYGCPELPYIYLKYEKKGLWGGKWLPVSVEQAPAALRDANLSQGDVSIDEYKHASLHKVHSNIRKVEGSSAGYFQAKIPREYDDWHNIYKNSYRDERRMNDCRPPPTRPLPTKEFEAARQHIVDAESKAQTINATITSFDANPMKITQDDFSRSKGVWTGHGYLSNSCDGIVKGIGPIREYDNNGGWHLIGAQIALKNGKEIPFQQVNLSKFQAPSLPNRVTCESGAIYAVSRKNKGNLLIHRLAYSGEILDAWHIVLPDTDRVATDKNWGDIWEVVPTNGNLSIVLADYSYTSTANLGGWINKMQTYAVQLPKLALSEIEQKVGPTLESIESRVVMQSSVKTFRDCPVCPEMAAVPNKDYAIGKYEVTQAEWDAVMGIRERNRDLDNKADQPVTAKDWNAVQSYIAKLNKLTGKKYRLPTEGEWIFACHGGSRMDFCGSNDSDTVGWFMESSKRKIQTVGQKIPNGYGLYDMSGNAWEWIGDCWKSNCDVHIVRGGSYMSHPLNVENAYMYGTYNGDVGFRLAGTLDDSRDGLIPEEIALEYDSIPSVLAACACSVGASIEECEQRCAR